MRTRTGVYTLLKVLGELCKYIVRFKPVLAIVSNNNVALMLALDATMAACDDLSTLLKEYENPSV